MPDQGQENLKMKQMWKHHSSQEEVRDATFSHDWWWDVGTGTALNKQTSKLLEQATGIKVSYAYNNLNAY